MVHDRHSHLIITVQYWSFSSLKKCPFSKNVLEWEPINESQDQYHYSEHIVACECEYCPEKVLDPLHSLFLLTTLDRSICCHVKYCFIGLLTVIRD